MHIPCRLAHLACLVLVLGAAPCASALIVGGKGNAPMKDNDWPAGAVDVANLKSRVGWWEGPLGGKQCFQYRGDTQTFQRALDLFAQIKAPELDVIVHEGPNGSDFLKDERDPKSDTSVDWALTLWNPESW